MLEFLCEVVVTLFVGTLILLILFTGIFGVMTVGLVYLLCSFFSNTFSDALLLISSPVRIPYFLWVMCKNRGADHGVAHGWSVMMNAWKIRIWLMTEKEGLKGLLRLDLLYQLYQVIGAALLHDVKDTKCRKYRPTGTPETYFEEKLDDFMGGVAGGEPMLKIISNISYRQEEELKKRAPNGVINWVERMGSIEAAKNRHAVSDADRLASLGKGGHYASQVYNSSNDDYIKADPLDRESVLYDLVSKIHHDKLKTLPDHMETQYGKREGKRLLKEFEEIHQQWGRKLGKM
jgi:hypothetical protein